MAAGGDASRRALLYSWLSSLSQHVRVVTK